MPTDRTFRDSLGRPLGRFGKYRLLRELGKGGMGQVFEGLDEELGRHVGIKVLPALLGRDPDFVIRFKREAKAAALLSHPNIVTIFDIGEEAGTHFIVMELLVGQDLEHRLREQRKIPESQALPLLIQALQGLDHAWQHGIVHRDLKPSNMMITRQGILKILDFGLARNMAALATRMTETGSGMGTPRYMAPEQFRDAKSVDFRADMYALGATFYHLLTGRVPYEGESAVELALKIASEELPPMLQLNPEISPRVVSAIEKMLHREADQRFANATEALTALTDSATPPLMQIIPLRGQETTMLDADGNNAIDLNATGVEQPKSVETESSESPRKYETSFGMRFVRIDPGEYIMGSPDQETGHLKDESLHRVAITRPFYMSVCPVTQRDFEIVIGANPSHFRGLDLPVEQVTWWDAMEFCHKLAKQEDRKYRLPTEAEWEYACRAGSTTAFFFGDDETDLRNYAWYCVNSGGSSKPVGRKERNTWGLYDMHGNVFEWCADWYGYYRDGQAIDPTGMANGIGRILRGGSWNLTPNYCRSALRNHRAPAYKHRNVGFRVVCLCEVDQV